MNYKFRLKYERSLIKIQIVMMQILFNEKANFGWPLE